jgi:6-phosphogluconolactonase
VKASDQLSNSGLLYRFGPFEADTSKGELRKFGSRIRLEPKPWRLLITLLQRPGELVTRRELECVLWGESVFVDFEHGVNVAVNKLRAALCDSVDAPCYLETVAREGYRFLAPVEVERKNEMYVPNDQHPTRLPTPDSEKMSASRKSDWIATGALIVILSLSAGLIGSRWHDPPVRVVRGHSRLAEIRRFVYVADFTRNAIFGYSVSPNTGVLEPIAPGPFKTGEHPYSAAFVPGHRFLYVVNRGRADEVCGDGCSISAYAVDSGSGYLVELQGSPFPAGLGPVAIAIHPSGTFVYVANVISNDVYIYTRKATGSLERIASPVSVGTHPFALTIIPSGRFLYVTNQDDATVSGFEIQSTGELRPVAGSPFATGLRPRSFTIDPLGRFAYVANYGVNPYLSHAAACSGVYGSAHGKGCTISVFAVDPHSGTLAEIKGSPFESYGTNPVYSVMDSPGKYFFVTNISSNNVSVFQVDSSTGVIRPAPGSPFPTGEGPISAALDWSDDYLYVANAYSANVSQFEIDTNSGRLHLISAPRATGVSPVNIVAER